MLKNLVVTRGACTSGWSLTASVVQETWLLLLKETEFLRLEQNLEEDICITAQETLWKKG